LSYYVGVDVGATKSAVVLADGTGAVIASRWIEHDGEWMGHLSETVLRAVDILLEGAPIGLSEIVAVGIAVCGLVSNDGGTIVYSPTLGEEGRDLGGEIAAALRRPVVVANDANATLLGHDRHDVPGERSAARPGTRISLLLTLGTGIGGAIMVDDTVLVGEHGFACELGHVIVDFDDQRRCACGNTGCVESYASGRGVAEMAVVTPPPPRSARLLSSLGAQPPYSARDVVGAADRGDPWATELLRLAGRMLGRAIAVLSVVVDPATVIVGGSFGHAARSWLLPAAIEEMRRSWSFARARPLPELVMDSIGPYAAAAGAALLAASTFEERQR
jgi:glucokinase